MANQWRELVERLLPWFDETVERQRNARTERIRQRSIASRIRAEKVIDEYERADAVAHVKHQNLIDEARRDIDQ